MAPLRSSRTTRNQEASAARARGGVADFDPTDGLPVSRWSQTSIRVNQDATPDTSVVAQSSSDWSAQFGTSQYPWPEPERPIYLKDIPTWNQEMIRRARAGTTNAKLSVWDRKNNCWISAAEAEKRQVPLKSLHLDNLDANNDGNNNADSPKSDQDDDDNDDDNMDEDDLHDEDGAPFKTPTISTKRRKTAGQDPRTFEVKRWVQVPVSIAEKSADPKFLAERRPGMPALYNPAYAMAVFGRHYADNSFSVANYDLGDGSGLSNAAGVMGSAAPAEAPPTPARRNIPPRRKKKKLGGPGRRKVNPAPPPAATAPVNTVSSNTTSLGPVTGGTEATVHATVTIQHQVMSDDQGIKKGSEGGGPENLEDEDEGSGSDSEGEGSEEGQILEGDDTKRPELNEVEWTVDERLEAPQEHNGKTEVETLVPEPPTRTTQEAQLIDQTGEQPKPVPEPHELQVVKEDRQTDPAVPSPPSPPVVMDEIKPASITNSPPPAPVDESGQTVQEASLSAPTEAAVPGVPTQSALPDEAAHGDAEKKTSEDVTTVDTIAEVPTITSDTEEGEMDLLSGLDQEIDRHMSEQGTESNDRSAIEKGD